jgi:hypothetical protein
VRREICISDDDPFSAAAVRNARAVDDRLRELAPTVKLARENITLLTRYEQVSAGLRDWKTFSSASRPWPYQIVRDGRRTGTLDDDHRSRSGEAAGAFHDAVSRLEECR